jgi:hypothetical protein
MSDWQDKLEIRELIERWVLWRDAGEWERFRTLWHDDGKMAATWTQSPVDEFIKLAREGQARGVSVVHFLGGQTIELAGDRAISQTKMTISQRGLLEGVECDVVCVGRFYDFLERRHSRWGLVFRQPIYERDRADPVDPSAPLKLDATLLARFPVGYRHLAYLQSQIGYPVKTDMPGVTGEALDELKARGDAWLAGKAVFADT